MSWTSINTLFLGCLWFIKNISATETDSTICDPKFVDYFGNEQLSKMEIAESPIDKIHINENAEELLERQEKVKQSKDASQVKEENRFFIDEKKVNDLNRNMKCVKETTFENISFCLPPLVKSNGQSTKMWYKMTQIFKKIYKNYSNIILQEVVDFDALEKTNSFKTLEVIDYFYETFMNCSESKEFFTNRFITPFYLLKDKNIESKLCKIKDFSLLENILSFHVVVSSRINDLDLDDLIKLLIYKVALIKQK